MSAVPRTRRDDVTVPARGCARCHDLAGELGDNGVVGLDEAWGRALALLPPVRHYEDHVLLTTLEPCCMCLGAAVQSTITQLYFAGRDPYGGASGLVVDTPQARRRPLTVAGPLPGLWGRFAELLHVRWLLDFGASEPVLAEQRRGIPGIYEVAAHPATGDLFGRLKGDSAGVEGALATSQALLRPLL